MGIKLGDYRHNHNIKLKEWLNYNHNDEELRKLFYNMSKNIKYIHDRDYYVKTFNLNEIEIINPETLNPIQYNTIIKSTDENNDEIKREDIYNLAFMQIGIYTEMLNVLRPDFLKENFDSFVPLLPEADVPYYRGIVTRGARVYYSDYIDEKNKREIENLQTATGEATKSSNLKGKQFVKATDAGRLYAAQAEKETRNLYSDIDSRKDAAFISFLLFPILLIALGLVLSVVFLIQ